QPQVRVTRTRTGRPIRPPGEWWKVQNPTTADTNPGPAPPSHMEDEEGDTIIPNASIFGYGQEDDGEVLSAMKATAHGHIEPNHLAHAQSLPEWVHWDKAVKSELASLEENDVYDIVDAPVDRKIVPSKWVFKIKHNADGTIDRYKARLVAKGFAQQPGVDFDEVFSPVVRYDSLRLLLGLAAVNGWKPRQLDIKTAFLYGKLKEEVYMQLPEGSRVAGKVAKLKRCIYGLKQAPREWFGRLVTFLRPYGFVSSTFDPCVLAHESGKLFLAIYVDDITVFGDSGPLLDQVIELLKTEFKVNDLGFVNWLLGIQIDLNNEGITLSQSAFIDKVLQRFNMDDCNPVSTPIEPNATLTRDSGTPLQTATRYQQIVGSIMYLVTATRPDLAFTITFLSQFASAPTDLHLKAAQRVLRYLKGTRDWKLLYPWNTHLALTGFSDASHGNCYDTRRSYSGYIFRLGDCTISWRAHKQKSVAHSTLDAEYMGLAAANRHDRWLTDALASLLQRSDTPAALFNDNMAAIDFAHNQKINDRTKHIDIAYHSTRELVESGRLVLMHVPGEDNLADICTKGLPRPRLEQLCNSITNTEHAN